ncbi:uncharacterized protein LOC135335837 [Halichondria panicea]|uniref:uncharacterized protein LOC135335837 n=1 Tax=Halichondria panicea TaxID=6063 RepID=UPI00312B628E
MPEMLKKQKVHLLLHLPESMKEFGPPSSFNTERCEAFKSKMRNYNVYSKAASSRDIALSFRLVCDGGTTLSFGRSVGLGLVHMYHSNAVQKFLNGATPPKHKAIYQPGALRMKQVQPASLSSVELKVGGEVMTLGSLPTGLSVDLLETFNLRDDVQRYGGVVSQAGHLFTVGNLLNWPPQTTCHSMVYWWQMYSD